MLNTINKPSIKGTCQIRDESNHRLHPFSFLSCLRFGAAHLVLEGSTQQRGHTHKLRPLDKPLEGWSWGECGLSLGWRKRGQWSASVPELHTHGSHTSHKCARTQWPQSLGRQAGPGTGLRHLPPGATSSVCKGWMSCANETEDWKEVQWRTRKPTDQGKDSAPP